MQASKESPASFLSKVYCCAPKQEGSSPCSSPTLRPCRKNAWPPSCPPSGSREAISEPAKAFPVTAGRGAGGVSGGGGGSRRASSEPAPGNALGSPTPIRREATRRSSDLRSPSTRDRLPAGSPPTSSPAGGWALGSTSTAPETMPEKRLASFPEKRLAPCRCPFVRFGGVRRLSAGPGSGTFPSSAASG